MLRPGTLDDVPKAAAMRQRAWPESIITEEGMRHDLTAVPARAERALFAFDEHGEILGWAASARAWWHPDPDAGILSVSVDPSRRGERIGSALAAAADDHLTRLAVRTTLARSLDEPAAQALARGRGFAHVATMTVSAVYRTYGRAPPGARQASSSSLSRTPRRSRSRLRRDLEVSRRRHPERGLQRVLAGGLDRGVLEDADDRC